MDHDPTVYCVSAYNDNGRPELVDDPGAVYRTDWFGGLGWLASRRLFHTEWAPAWPPTHWDHWLRHPARRRGRECLYPEVSRDVHTGAVGIHSDPVHFARYSAPVRLHAASASGPGPAGPTRMTPPHELVLGAYEDELMQKGHLGPFELMS